MDITTLAAWGEFLGGIAVVVSLVYLASQIRQNSKLLSSSTASMIYSPQNEGSADTQSGEEGSCIGGNMIRIGVIAAVLLLSGCSEPGTRTAEEAGTRTAEEAANVAAREAETEAFNAQQLDRVERFYSEDWISLSYVPWAPQGMSNNREAVKQGLAAGVLFFPDRRITILSLIAEGDTVVEESEWIGTASDQHPTLQEGVREIFRTISYNRYRDGKIVETREYGVAVSEPPTQEPEP